MPYQTDRATIPKKSIDCRNISSLYLPGAYAEAHSSCGGLRAAGSDSEIRVFDSVTNKLKRILSPDGKKVIKEFI